MREEPLADDVVLANFNVLGTTGPNTNSSVVLAFRLHWVMRCLQSNQCRSGAVSASVAEDMDESDASVVLQPRA